MENLLEFHPEARFIFYNPKIAYGLNENLRKYILCLNKKFILDLLSDKFIPVIGWEITFRCCLHF